MSQTTTESAGWTTADLDLFPDDGNRYEIVEGELCVTRAPNWRHQRASTRISTALDVWSQATGLGETVQAPGIIFSNENNVIPDVVWVSRDRLAMLLDEEGHLTAAPELVVEVLSLDHKNERCDRELKLKLYSSRGVQEYWIIDWSRERLEIYRRESVALQLCITLLPTDSLTSPLLPGFTYPIAQLFVQVRSDSST